MHNNIINDHNKYFNAVMQSVEHWYSVETEIENEKKQITQFDDYLSKNAAEIEKFHTIENEVVVFLKQYSYEKGINLSPAKNILQPLPDLKQKLVELGTEAKKLADKPDRHNCHKAMEVCKKLTLFCANEMKSTDYNKITTLLEHNILKLHEIQNKFANEDTDVLNLSEKIQQLSGQIKNYADRFNKNIALNKAQQLLQSVEQTKFSSFAQIKQELEQCVKQIEVVIANFDKERKDTVALKNKLNQNSPNSWSEDNEQLISEINDVIKKDTATVNFSLQSFYDKEENNKQKKSNRIATFRQQYERISARYNSQLQNDIIGKYVPLSELNRWINKYEAIEKERIKEVTKKTLIGLGIAAGVGLVIAFWKYILMVIAVIVVIAIIGFFLGKD